MTNGFWRMPLPPEMNALQAEVGGDKHFVSGRNTEHRAIVAYASHD
jgi:hypothetical protein